MASLLLALYILLLRGSAFVVPISALPEGMGPLANWVYAWIGHSGDVPNITAMVLLLLQAFYLNILVSEHRLATEVSLFPGLFYILVCSLLPAFHYLSPALMANTFFLIVLGEAFSASKKLSAAGEIFNMGFWAAVGALFCPSYLLLGLLAFVTLNILRAFKFSERLMVIIGMFIPYFLLGTYAFWKGQYGDYLAEVKSGFQLLDFVPTPYINVYIGLGIMGVLVLVSLFSYRNHLLKQNIDVQRKINIVYWGLLIVAAPSFIIQAGLQIDHLLILAPPLGLLLSLNFIRMPARTAEVLHLLIVLLALGLQFAPVLFPD